MVRLLSVLFLLVGLCTLLTAQRPVEVNFTHADGLFTNQVIHLGLDTEGRLWMSYPFSDRFSRFDGLNWEHWDLMEEGIGGNFQILAGDHNGFWFEGKDHVLRFSNEEEWHKLDVSGYETFYHPHYEQVVFLDKTSGDVYLFDAEEPDFFYPSNLSFNFETESKQNKEIYLSVHHQEEVLIYSYYTEPWQYIEKYDLVTGDKLNQIKKPFKSVRFHFAQNTWFFWRDGIMNVYKNGELVPFEYRSREDRVFELLSDARVWDGSRLIALYRVRESRPGQSPYYHYITLNENLEAVMFMENIHRTAKNSIVILPNGDKVYSSGSGLFLRRNGIIHISDKDYPMVTGLHMVAEDGQGNIWFGGYDGEGGFAYFDGNAINSPKDPRLQIGRIIPGTYTDTLGRVYFFKEGSDGIHRIVNGKHERAYSWDFFRTGYFLKELSDGSIGVGANRIGFMKFDPENPFDYYLVGEEKGMDFHNILSFDEDKNGRIWMGRTSKGIAAYCFKTQVLGKWDRNSPEALSDGTMATVIDSAQNLWAGGNKGLYYLKNSHLYDIENGNLFKDWSKINLPGPSDQFITTIMESSKYVIVGSDYAIHFIPRNQDFENTLYPRIHSLVFDIHIPGIATEQNTILEDSNGFLWVGTKQGALRFDMDLLEFDETDTEVAFTQINAGNQQIDPTNDILRLPGGARSLNLNWRAKGNVFLQDDVHFRVTLFKKDDSIFFQEDSRPLSTLVNYLPPGNYRLRLEAIKHNQVNNYVEKMVIVPYHWFENPWHVVALTLMVVAFIALIHSMRTKQRRLEAEKVALMEKNQTQMDQLRVKALSNYFNPHFINNVLHWIQSKYRKDPETTKIVGKLAENVHFLFHNTMEEKKAHALAKELEIVDNYVDIALTRFGDIFEYKKNFKLSEKTMSEVKVPNLLIQIHVENAIEKGIRGNTDYGLLEITLKEDDEFIHVEVLDNGAGRSNSENSSLERKSSTKVMEEIIHLLNKSNDSHIDISYEDNCMENSKSGADGHGTRVKIQIPKIYNYG